jgi:phosphate transport system substrate-binding protein
MKLDQCLFTPALLRWASGAASAATAADITGAGATFPYPVYAKWAEAYKAKSGNGMNYQSIGSGGGIKRSRPRPSISGASDAR